MNTELKLEAGEFIQNVSKWFSKSAQDKVSIMVARPNGEDMVVLSASEYRSLQETAYLMRHPINAARLLEGVQMVKDSPETGKTLTDIDALWK